MCLHVFSLHLYLHDVWGFFSEKIVLIYIFQWCVKIPVSLQRYQYWMFSFYSLVHLIDEKMLYLCFNLHFLNYQIECLKIKTISLLTIPPEFVLIPDGGVLK